MPPEQRAALEKTMEALPQTNNIKSIVTLEDKTDLERKLCTLRTVPTTTESFSFLSFILTYR